MPMDPQMIIQLHIKLKFFMDLIKNKIFLYSITPKNRSMEIVIVGGLAIALGNKYTNNSVSSNNNVSRTTNRSNTNNLSNIFTKSNVKVNACGDTTIADMSWPSASLMANVDKAILEAMGCEVEFVVGATMTTFT